MLFAWSAKFVSVGFGLCVGGDRLVWVLFWIVGIVGGSGGCGLVHLFIARLIHDPHLYSVLSKIAASEVFFNCITS